MSRKSWEQAVTDLAEAVCAALDVPLGESDRDARAEEKLRFSRASIVKTTLRAWLVDDPTACRTLLGHLAEATASITSQTAGTPVTYQRWPESAGRIGGDGG